MLPAQPTQHFIVRLPQYAKAFPCAPGETVLSAALNAGLLPANSCRNGTCRTCMCRLQSGQVAYVIEWPGLSFDEKIEGYILACVAKPLSDLDVLDLALSQT